MGIKRQQTFKARNMVSSPALEWRIRPRRSEKQSSSLALSVGRSQLLCMHAMQEKHTLGICRLELVTEQLVDNLKLVMSNREMWRDIEM